MQIKTNQKGITLTSLVIYMMALTIVMAAMTAMSTYFYDNIGEVLDTPKYLGEFNKFTMFFVADIKNYSSATVTDTTIEFENGPTYVFKNGGIYRNDFKIADYIMSCTFTEEEPYKVGTISKNIINVNMQIGKNENRSVTQNLDFTLKYW